MNTVVVPGATLRLAPYVPREILSDGFETFEPIWTNQLESRVELARAFGAPNTALSGVFLEEDIGKRLGIVQWRSCIYEFDENKKFIPIPVEFSDSSFEGSVSDSLKVSTTPTRLRFKNPIKADVFLSNLPSKEGIRHQLQAISTELT